MFTCLLFYFHSFTSWCTDTQTLPYTHSRTHSHNLYKSVNWDARHTIRLMCLGLVRVNTVCPVYAYGWLSNIHVLMSFDLSDRWKHVVYTIRSSYLVQNCCALVSEPSFWMAHTICSWSSILFTEFTVWFPFRINLAFFSFIRSLACSFRCKKVNKVFFRLFLVLCI